MRLKTPLGPVLRTVQSASASRNIRRTCARWGGRILLELSAKVCNSMSGRAHCSIHASTGAAHMWTELRPASPMAPLHRPMGENCWQGATGYPQDGPAGELLEEAREEIASVYHEVTDVLGYPLHVPKHWMASGFVPPVPRCGNDMRFPLHRSCGHEPAFHPCSAQCNGQCVPEDADAVEERER